MAKYRKKPVVIEAEQYIPDGPLCEGVCRCARDPASRPHVHTAHADQIVVLEGEEWIVPESKAPGRFYPIKPDVFAATYEPA